jgi:hypothetical protein
MTPTRMPDERREPGDEQLEPEQRGHVRSLRADRRSVWWWPNADPQG